MVSAVISGQQNNTRALEGGNGRPTSGMLAKANSQICVAGQPGGAKVWWGGVHSDQPATKRGGGAWGE